MTPTINFEDAFEQLTGNRPFGWQQRLFEDWLSRGELPVAVDIPTGLGKTAVMAIWLLARAVGADLPRRLVYVVDRRAVVDQATRFAQQLRANVPTDVALGLGLEGNAGGLPISTLRGGFADNRDWLEDPAKPAIIVGTIDMIGSRILFEGYGVSRRMRPYHAGFLGVDTLVLLDEAHLCPPFEVLLRQIVNYSDCKFGPSFGVHLPPPIRVIPLSATGRPPATSSSEFVFRLAHADREERVVSQRLTAQKRLGVTELTDAHTLVSRMADRAIELAGGGPCRVVVYCDRRKDALEVKRLIDKRSRIVEKHCESTLGWESELLVGERRVRERSDLESWLARTGFLGDSKAQPNSPTFLVATSAGEVGVDLDADHMVCDLVAHERMVQRLGRVNRRGHRDRAAIVDVFTVRPDLKANVRKAEKGKFQSNLETYRRQMAPLLQLLRGEDGRHDACPSALEALKHDHPDIVLAATTPVPLHPELTRPLVDAWTLTSLKRHEGRPEVGPWLRGWVEDDLPQTEVAWRRHLPYLLHSDGTVTLPSATVTEFFRSAPVHATERLEGSSSHVFDWLLKRAGQIGDGVADHDAAIADGEIVAILMDQVGEHRASASLRDLQRLADSTGNLTASERKSRDRDKRNWKEQLLPGALLVVDARIGGLRDGMLDEKSMSEAVVADSGDAWEAPDREPSLRLIGFRIERVEGDKDGEGLRIVPDLEGWRHAQTFETHFDAAGVAQEGLAIYKWLHGVTDEYFRSISSAPQALADHAEEVAARACDLATRLGLPDEEIDALITAGRLHDEGKASERWQNAMNAPAAGRPYAKTRSGGNWRLLEGYRHEFGSLLAAMRTSLPDRTRDLILHLIAAHHGNARPMIRSRGCEDGPPSALEFRAGEVALRFERLQKRYGPWGLAWREAILRAADQSVSREHSRRHGGGPNG